MEWQIKILKNILSADTRANTLFDISVITLHRNARNSLKPLPLPPNARCIRTPYSRIHIS